MVTKYVVGDGSGICSLKKGSVSHVFGTEHHEEKATPSTPNLPSSTNPIISNSQPSLFTFTKQKTIPFVSEIYENQVSLGLCKTTATLSVKTDLTTGEQKYVLRSNPCDERNCMKCYPERVAKIKKRLNPLFRSIPENQRLTHLIATTLPVKEKDMTLAKYKNFRKKGHKLTRWFNNNCHAWGFGVPELKYDPVKHEYRPHFHILALGWLPSAKLMYEAWKKINNNHGRRIIIKTAPRGREARIKRKFKMLDYFARRCAGAGLVMGTVESNVKGKKTTKEVPLQSIPDYVYASIIKSSRLFFIFGKRHLYYDEDFVHTPKKRISWWNGIRYLTSDDVGKRTKGKWRFSNIPKDILHTWKQRCKKEQEYEALFEVCHVTIISNYGLPGEGGSPPPNLPTIEELNNFIDSQGYEGKTRYRQAFLALSDSILDPKSSDSGLNCPAPLLPGPGPVLHQQTHLPGIKEPPVSKSRDQYAYNIISGLSKFSNSLKKVAWPDNQLCESPIESFKNILRSGPQSSSNIIGIMITRGFSPRTAEYILERALVEGIAFQPNPNKVVLV